MKIRKNIWIAVLIIITSIVLSSTTLFANTMTLNIPDQSYVGDSFKITWSNSGGVNPVVTASTAHNLYILPDMTAICFGTGTATVNGDFKGTKVQKNMDIFATSKRAPSNYPRIISNYFIYKSPDNRFRGVPHAVGETVYITIEGIAPFRVEIGNQAVVQEAGWFNAMKSSRSGVVEFLLALRGGKAGETYIKVTDGKGVTYTVPHAVWNTRLDAPATVETGATMVSTVKTGGKLSPCDNTVLKNLQ